MGIYVFSAFVSDSPPRNGVNIHHCPDAAPMVKNSSIGIKWRCDETDDRGNRDHEKATYEKVCAEKKSENLVLQAESPLSVINMIAID